jgi:hypothetical protein
MQLGFWITVAVTVFSLAATAFSGIYRRFGWTWIASIVCAIALTTALPLTYNLAGYSVPVVDGAIEFLEYARGWILAFVLPIWLVIVGCLAAGTTYAVDDTGWHRPPVPAGAAPGTPPPAAPKQMFRAWLYWFSAAIFCAIGIVLLANDYSTKPNEALVKLFKEAERSPLKQQLDAKDDPFAMTIPADLMPPAKVDQFKRDVLAELKKIGGYDAITDVKIVSVRHDAATSKHLSGAVVYFQANDPAKTGEFKDEILWLDMDFILSEEETTKWAKDAAGYLQRSAPPKAAGAGGPPPGTYLPQPSGALSGPATFSRVGKVAK